MGPILLDVNAYNNLYDAWNGQQIERIDDYDSSDMAKSYYVSESALKLKQHPNCIKETWISKLPKVLTFSLNRVQYDRNAKCLAKNSKRFEFTKEIYADQFMLENQNLEGDIELKLKDLKESQISIKKKL
jgi:Ubiquitin carboxyl-terminal hydrolase